MNLDNVLNVSVCVCFVVSQFEADRPWFPRRRIKLGTKVISYIWINTNILHLLHVMKAQAACVSPETRHGSILVACKTKKYIDLFFYLCWRNWKELDCWLIFVSLNSPIMSWFPPTIFWGGIHFSNGFTSHWNWNLVLQVKRNFELSRYNIKKSTKG